MKLDFALQLRRLQHHDYISQGALLQPVLKLAC